MGTELVDGLDSIREYLSAEKAPATRRAYESDFADFETWCRQAAAPSLPAAPLEVARYLVSLADRGFRPSTIVRRCAAIRDAHRARSLEPPTNAEGVRAVLRGIRRKIGTAPDRKAPVTAKIIATIAAQVPATLAGRRDRALILLGFAAALRRSELVALDAEDIEFTPEGMRVSIRRSKTDQEGAGYAIAVPHGTRLRPMQAVRDWLDASHIAEGALFRSIGKGGALHAQRLSDRAVAEIVKRHARLVGLDADLFSGHSLRAGFVTSALESGADLLRIMDVTRHRNINSLKAYDRRARGFGQYAGKGFL